MSGTSHRVRFLWTERLVAMAILGEAIRAVALRATDWEFLILQCLQRSVIGAPSNSCTLNPGRAISINPKLVV
jgi:hypothetical protein